MVLVRPSAIVLLALGVGACASGPVETQWTPYRKYYRLVSKKADCSVYVVHDKSAIPTHIGIASMTYKLAPGLASSQEDATQAFRAEACRIGADGLILGQYWGQTASATAFVWGPLPPAPAS